MKGSNLGLAILSLVLALFFWGLVNGPSILRKVEVPVRLDGLPPAGFDIRLHPDDVNVGVHLQGPANTVKYLPRESVKAWVDLTEIGTDQSPAQVKVHVEAPSGVRVIAPPRVTLLVTRLVQRNLPVTLSFITVPKPGTAVGSYLLSPDTVTVEGGSEEALDRVEYVTVAVDARATLSKPREVVPHAVDADGEIMPDVHVLTPTVEVRMTSHTGQQTTRRVAVRPPALRNQPRRYRITVSTVTPDEVVVSGEPAILDRQPAYLETDALDVHALRHDTAQTVRLKVPPGLRVVEGPEVRVQLQVHPLD